MTEYSERLALKPPEAAKLIGVSLPVMYQLCRREDFPAVRLGRAIIIPRAAFEAWLDREACNAERRVTA